MSERVPRARARTGAASTETVVVVTAVAVVLLVGVTVFGHKLSALWTGSSTSLDRSAPAVTDRASSALDINTDTTVANPAGTTNPEVEAARAAINGKFPLTGFRETDLRRIEAAIAAFPAAIRDVAIAGVSPVEAANAFFNPPKTEDGAPTGNDVQVGTGLISPNSPGGINDAIGKLRGVDPRITLEELLFHEFVHAFEFNGGQAIADAFVGIAFEGKKAALEADPAFRAALERKEEIQSILRERAKAKGIEVAEDDIDPDAFAAVFADDPALRDEFFAVNREISRLTEAHGFPSVFPGDKHAADNPHEFFAVVLQIAKFRPDQFRRFRELANDADPSNDVLTPDEIAFLDSHPELLN